MEFPEDFNSDGASSSAEDREELEQRLYSLIHYGTEGGENSQGDSSYIECFGTEEVSRQYNVDSESSKQECYNGNGNYSLDESTKNTLISDFLDTNSPKAKQFKNSVYSVNSNEDEVTEQNHAQQQRVSAETLVEEEVNVVIEKRTKTKGPKHRKGRSKSNSSSPSKREYIRIEGDRDSLTTDESSLSDDDLTSLLKDAGLNEIGDPVDSSDDSLSADDMVLISDDEQGKALDIQVHSHQDSGIQLDCDSLEIKDDFTLEDVLNQLPDDGWHMVREDRPSISKPLSGRYYQPLTFRCYNCNQIGHLSVQCPKPKKLPSCILCGTRGHRQYECPEVICVKCNEMGHNIKYCQNARTPWFTDCRRCWMFGHMSQSCPQRWRQFHLTTAMGQLRVSNGSKENNRKYCYNCGMKGHFGHECAESSKYNCPAQPFVMQYDTLKTIYKPKVRKQFDLLDAGREESGPVINKNRVGKAINLPNFCQNLSESELGKITASRDFLVKMMKERNNDRRTQSKFMKEKAAEPIHTVFSSDSDTCKPQPDFQNVVGQPLEPSKKELKKNKNSKIKERKQRKLLPNGEVGEDVLEQSNVTEESINTISGTYTLETQSDFKDGQLDHIELSKKEAKKAARKEQRIQTKLKRAKAKERKLSRLEEEGSVDNYMMGTMRPQTSQGKKDLMRQIKMAKKLRREPGITEEQYKKLSAEIAQIQEKLCEVRRELNGGHFQKMNGPKRENDTRSVDDISNDVKDLKSEQSRLEKQMQTLGSKNVKIEGIGKKERKRLIKSVQEDLDKVKWELKRDQFKMKLELAPWKGNAGQLDGKGSAQKEHAANADFLNEETVTSKKESVENVTQHDLNNPSWEVTHFLHTGLKYGMKREHSPEIPVKKDGKKFRWYNKKPSLKRKNKLSAGGFKSSLNI